ncbi:MAG: caspase family protein [Sinobacteraceae bacterium]|nr:caspase family protein [Nevskiaceae bacterium]
MTYLSPRRPVRTTTADCRVRGGEYVAYDRADTKSALRIWLPSAESGSAEAQNNVGEIYERGVGGQPDYAAAALWYQKAAAQNYSRAQVNLGALYEQGLGVDKDELKALNLYRQAAGLPENSVIYADAARREEDALRTELTRTVQEKDAQLEALKKQVQELEQKVREQSSKAAAASAPSPELEALRGLVKQLESDKAQAEQHLASVARTRAPTEKPPEPLDPKAALRTVQGQNIGRFYALVIGNQDYRNIDRLQTPHSDASRAAQILRDKYGFTVQQIDDADDVTMLEALNDLDKVVRPEDNVLIYYAGHGWRIKAGGGGELGYWLPVNADPPPNDTFWVPNEQVTAHLGRLAAKRVLVVADSCYAGLLSADPSANLFGDEASVSSEYLKYKLPKRSRLLLASGGDQPVLDAVAGRGNSVFAHAFLDVLQSNTSVLSTPALFEKIRDRVRQEARQNAFVQSPDLKSIKSAGHEMGDFFFVPVGKG